MPQGRSKNSAYQRSLLSSTVCMDVTIYPVLVFVLTFFGLALSAWIGVLFSRNRGVEAAVREDFGIILAATLTLQALIVGFTFRWLWAATISVRTTRKRRPTLSAQNTRGPACCLPPMRRKCGRCFSTTWISVSCS